MKYAWFTSTDAPILRWAAQELKPDLVFANRDTANIKDFTERMRIPTTVIDAKKWYTKQGKEYKDREQRYLYDMQILQILRLYDIDFIVCDSYRTLLSADLLKAVDAYNIHYGNIDPKAGPTQIGLHTLNMIDGPNITATFHCVDEGIDTGAIISTQKVTKAHRHKEFSATVVKEIKTLLKSAPSYHAI